MGFASSFENLAATALVPRRVLNVGSGPGRAPSIYFATPTWRETRFDIDPGVKPDVVGSFVELEAAFEPRTFDAIWSSHSLEHLAGHDVPRALAGARALLKGDGFALMRCPDLEVACRLILERGIDSLCYLSPSGPVTPLDMLYGHGPSIARDQAAMAHRTGFTSARLAHCLLEAGFGTVFTMTDRFDLWVLALAGDGEGVDVRRELAAAGLDFSLRAAA